MTGIKIVKDRKRGRNKASEEEILDYKIVMSVSEIRQLCMSYFDAGFRMADTYAFDRIMNAK